MGQADCIWIRSTSNERRTSFGRTNIFFTELINKRAAEYAVAERDTERTTTEGEVIRSKKCIIAFILRRMEEWQIRRFMKRKDGTRVECTDKDLRRYISHRLAKSARGLCEVNMSTTDDSPGSNLNEADEFSMLLSDEKDEEMDLWWFENILEEETLTEEETCQRGTYELGGNGRTATGWAMPHVGNPSRNSDNVNFEYEETADSVSLGVDLSDVEMQDVKVEYDNNNYLHVSCSGKKHRPFATSIFMGKMVDVASVKAWMDSGTLTLTMSKYKCKWQEKQLNQQEEVPMASN